MKTKYHIIRTQKKKKKETNGATIETFSWGLRVFLEVCFSLAKPTWKKMVGPIRFGYCYMEFTNGIIRGWTYYPEIKGIDLINKEVQLIPILEKDKCQSSAKS